MGLELNEVSGVAQRLALLQGRIPGSCEPILTPRDMDLNPGTWIRDRRSMQFYTISLRRLRTTSSSPEYACGIFFYLSQQQTEILGRGEVLIKMPSRVPIRTIERPPRL
jgi:hypothetical protein